MKTLLFYKKLFIVFIGLCAVIFFCASKTLNDPVPIDDSIIKEQLENGLTVYLYPFDSSSSPGSVVIQTTIRAGIIHETDEEIGLAHFLEHMAYNSTEKYNQKEIASIELELSGANSSAYTGRHHTNHKRVIHNPTPERLEKLFDLVSQQTMHITFNPEEVEKERGVVLAEEKEAMSNKQRVEKKYAFNKKLEGSLYTERYFPGPTETIENATPEQLKKYYDTWYTPPNIAIAVLGDIDPVQIMSLIQKYFGAVQKPQSPPQPTIKPFNPYSRKFDVYINPSSFTTKVSISNIFYKKESNTISNFLEFVINSILTDFLQNSFEQYLQEKKYDSALFNISSSYDDPILPVPGLCESSIHFEIDGNRIEEGIQEIQNFLANVHKALKSDEFNSEILIDISKYTASYKNTTRYFKTPEEMANYIVNDFVYEWPILDYSKIHPYAEMMDSQITQEAVVRVFEKHIYNPTNQMVFVSTSNEQNPFVQDANPANTRPKTVDLEQIFSKNIVSNINLFQEDKPFEDYIEYFENYVDFRPAGTVIKEEVYPDTVSGLTIYEWTLSNGITALFYPTKETKALEIKVLNRDILKHRYSVGNINIPNIFNQALEYSYIKDMLLYDFIDGFFSYRVYIYSSLNLLSYYLWTQWTEWTDITPKILQVLFEQLYTMNTIMNVQEAAFKRAKSIYSQTFYSSLKYPLFYTQLVNDSLIYKNHPNFVDPLNEKSIMDISMDDMNKVTDTLFNSKDMMFFLYGNVEAEIVKDLVEKYIASLPTKDSDPLDYTQLQYPIEPYEGKIIRLDNNPIATINYEYHSLVPQDELQTTDKEQLTFQFASMYLQSIVNNRLREELGKIYYAKALITKYLDSSNVSGEYSLNINFSSDIEFADSLFAEVKTILDNIDPIDTTLLEEVRYKMKNISAKNIQYENDIDGITKRYNILPWPISKKQQEKIINEITAQDIENAIKKVLEGKKIAFITLPKNL